MTTFTNQRLCSRSRDQCQWETERDTRMRGISLTQLQAQERNHRSCCFIAIYLMIWEGSKSECFNLTLVWTPHHSQPIKGQYPGHVITRNQSGATSHSGRISDVTQNRDIPGQWSRGLEKAFVWSRVITWPGYRPLIGQDWLHTNPLNSNISGLHVSTLPPFMVMVSFR